jgi:hypothetical protein
VLLKAAAIPRSSAAYFPEPSVLSFDASFRGVDSKTEESMPASVENDRAAKSRRIRDLNDAFRKSLDPNLGRLVMTSGVSALPSDVRAMAIRETETFDAFSADNDPHGEHDFGSFDLAGHKFFFKIDYYDSTLEFGSEDPAMTTRVLTLMLAEEY